MKLSNRLDALKNTINLFGKLVNIFTPPPKITISEWAAQYRMLTTEDSAFPGPWHNEVTPYLVDVMDALNDPCTEKIVMMFAIQTGKSSLMTNVIGYHIDLDPCPMIIYEPTGALAEAFSRTKIAPMLRETPRLKGKVPDEKSRTPGNTIEEKVFPGGNLSIVGSNSPNQFRMRSVRIVMLDELDSIRQNVGGEGDPYVLAKNRTANFPNRKIIVASTPVDEKGISLHYLDSTRERWTHECPSCATYSPFSWKRLKLDTLKMACPDCGNEHSKREWLQAPGKWIAEDPDHTVRGFHLSSLDAPTLTWQALVAEFTTANARSKLGDHEALQSFINTKLAEVWVRPGTVVETHDLEDRREVYNAELPDGVCVLTAGVDVQDTRLAVGVWGWGYGFENWAIEYTEFFGDPRQGEVWKYIDDLIERSWSYANGKKLRISRIGVDTGGSATMSVYTYCKARETRGVCAMKGQGGDRTPMTKPGKSKTGQRLIMVGVDGIKSDIYSWLKKSSPGSEYCHFPMSADIDPIKHRNLPINGIGSDFFDMLTSEKRVAEKDKNGFIKYTWVKIRERNEVLDCFVAARAALRAMSTRDDMMLKRMSLTMPWAPIEEPPNGIKDVINTIDVPPARKTKPKRIDRNKTAALQGISL